MYIDEDGNNFRFYPGAVACMQSLTDRDLEYSPAADVDEIIVDGGSAVMVAVGANASFSSPFLNATHDEKFNFVTAFSEDDADARDFILDLMVKCASRQESFKKEIPAAAKKMEKKRFVRQANLVAKRKGLPSDIASKISTFAGKRKKKTRKALKKKARKTRRR